MKKNYKVKRILVNPSGILSLQKHKKRSEHWTIIKGVASVTLQYKIFDLNYGESIDIKIGEIHRLENKTKEDLELIEIQMGSYLEKMILKD